MNFAEDWKKWTPAAQEKALERLREENERPWKPFYCPRRICDGRPHGPSRDGVPWDFEHARTDQRPPPGDWLTWLMLAGRGAGKTRGGSEWTHRLARKPVRIALISPTGPDIRDTQVEGESGILATAPPGMLPEWEPSKRKLTWPTGAVAYGYSGEEPDRLRGKQFHYAWTDEPAHMPLIQEVWDNLLFGLRLKLGPNFRPRICATTTPLPVPWNKNMVKDPTTAITTASTYDNIHNLASTFRDIILGRYEGTRKGKQEIYGELLEDVEGALWQHDWIQYLAPDVDPELTRIGVSIDPAGTARKTSDDTGIVVVGTDNTDFFVMADYSGKYSPSGWAKRAIAAYHEFSADYIIAEKNYGGDMVRAVLQNEIDKGEEQIRVVDVTSRRGKALRADPVATLYEKGRVWHVNPLDDLETQLTSWVPGDDSPDRLDALVHGISNLAVSVAPTVVADPTTLSNVTPLRRRSA